MGEWIRLSARDGHTLDAYRAAPEGRALAGIVVVQEVFGLTPHMTHVVDRYANSGFEAIAPALFDRVGRGLVFDYTDLEKGRETMRRLEWPNTLADVQAAAEALGEGRAIGIVGFCWGGTVVHVAASELRFAAGVSYYGSAVARMLDRTPRCPMLYQFGDRDQSIPPEDIERIKTANPDALYHVYPGAGHGFDCEDRASFNPDAAAIAFGRSVAFLREHLIGADTGPDPSR